MSLKAVIPLAAAIAAWTVYDNFRLTVSRYAVAFRELPEEFDGFKIVQVSDLHNARFGREQSRLMSAIRAEKPDLIAITGDLFHTLRRENAYSFLEQVARLAPCYYVSGNHEQRFADYFTAIKPKLQSLGAVVLDDEAARIQRGGSYITVIGLADPSFQRHIPPERLTHEKLARLCGSESGFTLLLSHRPELFLVYTRHNVSLALTGHAHGGQIRIPLAKRGLFAVHQGWFPKYTEGIFVENNTKMIVSRSLGNSTLYPKINDPPELVSVQLRMYNG
ncbi:MAG: metallophosphoesterase [Oscillospiraceae bacterium]|nr:metallophosphoesterase [Oscillospiraceae bacterium]